MKKTIELTDGTNGFSERDLHSKAILNNSRDMLLKYKIQRNRFNNLSSASSEIENVKRDINEMREEMVEIKQLLLQLVAGKK